MKEFKPRSQAYPGTPWKAEASRRKVRASKSNEPEAEGGGTPSTQSFGRPWNPKQTRTKRNTCIKCGAEKALNGLFIPAGMSAKAVFTTRHQYRDAKGEPVHISEEAQALEKKSTVKDHQRPIRPGIGRSYTAWRSGRRSLGNIGRYVYPTNWGLLVTKRGLMEIDENIKNNDRSVGKQKTPSENKKGIFPWMIITQNSSISKSTANLFYPDHDYQRTIDPRRVKRELYPRLMKSWSIRSRYPSGEQVHFDLASTHWPSWKCGTRLDLLVNCKVYCGLTKSRKEEERSLSKTAYPKM